MINLLEETKRILQVHGKSLKDIVWLGTEDEEISLSTFIKNADIEYYSGYGRNEVNLDLVIVGEDFWLERAEYDGSEWWEYKEMPTRPSKKALNTKRLIWDRY